jgi:hypothetical protein
MTRRVPVIREVAVLEDFAVIAGYSTEFLGRLLTGYPGGLERLLARSGVAAERRDDVLRAVGALVHVGTSWRLKHEGGSGSGTSPGGLVDPGAPSQRGLSSRDRNGETSPAARGASPFLGTAEVASALGVSPPVCPSTGEHARPSRAAGRRRALAIRRGRRRC